MIKAEGFQRGGLVTVLENTCFSLIRLDSKTNPSSVVYCVPTTAAMTISVEASDAKMSAEACQESDDNTLGVVE